MKGAGARRLGLLALAVALASRAASAACPCYTASSSANTYHCGIEAAPGTNPSLTQWKGIFALVSGGPAAWGSAGPAVGSIGQGCGRPTPNTSVPARFPCELLMAIAMQESGWKQFCVPTTPSDQVGGAERTIISFDCGYGVGQVTSGMHQGETPAFDRALVASDATYNLATGTQILAEKWRATNCVGDNLPAVIEHWYSAAWAYNGLSYSNNPNNPNFSSTRGVWRPSVGGAAPYQEHVFGWMEYPPSTQHWASLPFAYPDPADIGTGSSPPSLPEPSCASPTDCARTRSPHVSSCFAADAGTVTPPVDAGRPAPDAGPIDPSDAGPPVTDDGGSGGLLPDGGHGTGGNPGLVSSERPMPADVVGGCGCSSASSGLSLALVALLRVAFRHQRRAPGKALGVSNRDA